VHRGTEIRSVEAFGLRCRNAQMPFLCVADCLFDLSPFRGFPLLRLQCPLTAPLGAAVSQTVHDFFAFPQ
jgi:hypothetical protein